MYFSEYERCFLCPRNCGAERNKDKKGFCGETKELRVARACLHKWEEPPISGQNGSGTIFFSGCSLSCVFCQNREISRLHRGCVIDEKRLKEIFFELKQKGAHNINLVTPSHFLPHIGEAIKEAKIEGFDLPFVYNTSGYEKSEIIASLRGKIDIFLTDFKYFSPVLSEKFSKAGNYFEIASGALDQMLKIAPEPIFDRDGMMRKGVIVRVLVLPSHTKDATEIIKYLHDTYKDNIYISIMNQFTPVNKELLPKELQRTLTRREYDKVCDFALDLGAENIFVQEEETCLESFIPQFDFYGVKKENN